MVRIEVPVPGRAYEVVIGAGVASDLVGFLPAETRVAAVVTDSNVGPRWGAGLSQSLEASGIRAPLLEIPAGEHSKSWTGLRRVVAFLEKSGVDRRGAVVALGGGVVGDLAGFAAAIWMRGVACYQLPTSLLAMVDSSVGGKTAIDTSRTKNGVGAFWQPAAVLADLDMLASLPSDQYQAAFAEIIKYGVTLDEELHHHLDTRTLALLDHSPADLELAISRSVSAKAAVVVADERESGWREVLNYGHTIGHALEVVSGYELVHGQAVAAGMRAAGWLSVQMGRCDPSVVEAQNRLLDAFGLTSRLPLGQRQATADVVAAVGRDKKAKGGEPKWVLLTAMGRAEVGQQVPADLVVEAVDLVLEGRL